MDAKALMPLIGCDSQRKTTATAAAATTTIIAAAVAANTSESNWMLSATFICCLCKLPFLMAFLFSNCFPALSILHFIVYPFLVPIFSITWHLRRIRLQFRRLFIVCIKSLLLLCFSLLLLFIVCVCLCAFFPYPQPVCYTRNLFRVMLLISITFKDYYSRPKFFTILAHFYRLLRFIIICYAIF